MRACIYTDKRLSVLKPGSSHYFYTDVKEVLSSHCTGTISIWSALCGFGVDTCREDVSNSHVGARNFDGAARQELVSYVVSVFDIGIVPDHSGIKMAS